MTTKKKAINIKTLITANPKVDPALIATARAEIKRIREQGFGHPGYGLANRKASPLTKTELSEPSQRRLPSRTH
jgi:hypothetical protein